MARVPCADKRTWDNVESICMIRQRAAREFQELRATKLTNIKAEISGFQPCRVPMKLLWSDRRLQAAI